MKSIVLFFTMLVATTAMAQPPDTLWTRTFGGSYNDRGACVQQTTDEGYIVAGAASGTLVADVLLLKTDANGDSMWTGIDYSSYSSYARDVRQTTDGGYIVLVSSYQPMMPASFYMILIKTDSVGDTLWTSAGVGACGSGWEGCVQQTADGGYIVTGGRYYGDFLPYDVLLAKTNPNGDVLWSRNFGGDYYDVGASVQQTTDEGYIIAGYTGSYGPESSDVWLIKTDSEGDTIWTRTFGGSYSDGGASVQQTADEGYIIAGNTESYGAGNADVWLIKTDSEGDTMWTRTFGGSEDDRGNSVQQTIDGGYIVVGNTESYGAGSSDFWLIKTDSLGIEQWNLTFGGSDWDEGRCIQQTIDGGYIVTGSTSSYGAGMDDVWLIRLDSEGTLINEIGSVPERFNLLGNYPNPFNASTTINYDLSASCDVEIAIFDILGRRAATLVREKQQAGHHSVVWNADGFASGIYFYRIQAGEYQETRKMLLLK